MRGQVRTLALVIVGVAATFFLVVSCGGGNGEAAEVTETEEGFKQLSAEATGIGVAFEWKFDGDTIEIMVQSPAQGWIGVGFDPDTIMKGSNMIMGYVEDGETHIADHYGDKLTDHTPDTELGGSNDVTLIEGSEDETGTTLHFTIPADSGDEYDKPLSSGQTHTVILAYGTEDNYREQHPDDARTSLEVEL